MKDPRSVDFAEPASFFESRLGPGMAFDHLSMAIRHAVGMPLAKRHNSARIVTKSGEQFGWQDINVLNERLRALDSKH
jgi:hypothetical protein